MLRVLHILFIVIPRNRRFLIYGLEKFTYITRGRHCGPAFDNRQGMNNYGIWITISMNTADDAKTEGEQNDNAGDTARR